MNFIRLLTRENFTLSLVALVAGSSIMILEILASRIIAPFFGSSFYTWTNLIGVILTSLSVGYYFGGKYADCNPSFSKMGNLLIFSSLSIFLSVYLQHFVIPMLLNVSRNISLNSIIAIASLFALPSILLAMVAPYTIRLALHQIKESGRVTGYLYALSTFGSIVGTFLAGYVLIPFMGSTSALMLVAILLFVLGIAVKAAYKLLLIVLFMTLLVFPSDNKKKAEDKFVLVDKETLYSHVRVIDTTDRHTKRPIYMLTTDIFSEQSAIFSDKDDDLVYRYTKYYRLGDHFNPSIENALMIGGGAYSYPKDFLETHQAGTIDVVEIDPQITELAYRYFNLKKDPRLNIFHEDGRVYINTNSKKYDAIYLDVAASYTPPFYLLTQEATKRIFESLSSDGVLITNTISSFNGKKSGLLKSVYATYKSTFPQVYIIPVWSNDHETQVQNNMVIALKTEEEPKWSSNNDEIATYLHLRWKKDIANNASILTDDFAPVEYYQRSLLPPYLLDFWL